jgi:hypothetical protein
MTFSGWKKKTAGFSGQISLPIGRPDVQLDPPKYCVLQGDCIRRASQVTEIDHVSHDAGSLGGLTMGNSQGNMRKTMENHYK